VHRSPHDPRHLAGAFLALHDDQAAVERRRPVFFAGLCALLVLLAAPLSLAVSADAPFFTQPAIAHSSGDDDDSSGSGDDDDDDDDEDSGRTGPDDSGDATGTENAQGVDHTRDDDTGDDDDSAGNEQTKSARGNSASQTGTQHSFTEQTRSAAGNSVSDSGTQHSVTRQSVSASGNSASNPDTHHSRTRGPLNG
jgi:hypothetical protein